MKMDFSFLNITEPEFQYQCETYQYWIIMNGVANINALSTNYHAISHDTFAFPKNCVITLSSDTSLSVGCIKLSDFEATSTTITYISHQFTDLIRKTFLFAYDLQGSHALNKDAMMNSISQLMFQTLLCLEPENLSLNVYVANIIDDIVNHFLETDYDVNCAIEKTGYSISHFRKLFHEQTGTSPRHFLILQRLEHSCKLMHQSPAATIKDIALQSGFSDPLYFSKLFRKYKGVSPSAYQKALFIAPK